MPRYIVLAFSACMLAVPAQAAVTVTIDKSIQQMTVEVDGRPLYHWPVSTGKGGQYDTPSGKYKAFRMERDHFSKEWDDAPMPHSIFFTQKGHAIHGSFDVKRLGTPASHGCVRLSPANAEKLYALVEQEGVLNTTVILTGVAPSGAPAVARRRLPRSDGLDEDYVQPQQQFGPRYGSNQPVSGNPYYSQQYVQPQYQPYGQPYALPRPGTIFRDPYTGQLYQQR
ncbi:MAG: L,D-transpeptidase [Alphaproteobacteria bacterium]|nr:MAG: L,D-transpeptidase [Alphaproteobacteria bacterium]